MTDDGPDEAPDQQVAASDAIAAAIMPHLILFLRSGRVGQFVVNHSVHGAISFTGTVVDAPLRLLPTVPGN